MYAQISPLMRLSLTLSLTAGLLCGTSVLALAGPQDGIIAAGSATISTNGTKTDIHQNSDRVVIDWRSFDIAPDEHTQFYQPSSNSIALNRIKDNKPSQIMGRLTANGNIVLINPNGVVFGAGSQIDVNGLIATTANIDNDKFMNGSLAFDKAGKANATIINNGHITAGEAGLVGLVAPNVINNGVITARMGRVELASASTVTVDLYGDNLMEVAIGEDVASQLVSNSGIIEAAGGTIALTAAAGKDIVNSLITVKGELKAPSISQKNGKIIIGAAGSNAVKNNENANKGKKQGTSRIIVEAKLDASGKNVNETGGAIEITGDDIQIKGGSVIDASGHSGGGDIKIGGDYQGKGTTATAEKVAVESGSNIINDAIETGDAGRTIIWSDGITSFEGLISARGGAWSGKGGFAEVSGHDWLNYNGFADLSATDDNDFGTLLLDPTDITISNGTDSNGGFSGGIYSGTGSTSNINVGTLQTQLGAANVTITTNSGQSGFGDITFADAVTWSANRALTLNADRDIIFNANVTAMGGNGNITATAGRDITINALVRGNGNTTTSLTAARHLTLTAAGTVRGGATGGVFLNAAGGTTTGTGLLNMVGTIQIGTGGLTLTSGLDGANRNDISLNGTNLQLIGATIGITNVTGFRDITFDRATAFTNNVTFTADRDLTLNQALTGNSMVFTLNSGRDMALKANLSNTTNGRIAAIAGRDLTLDSGVMLTSGNTASGGISLQAAGGNVAGTGFLNMNGILNNGGGTLTLLSGLNGTARNDFTLTSSNLLSQGATIGALSITGFGDLIIDRDITSSSSINITAEHDFTLNSGRTLRVGSGNALLLRAAGGTVGNEGSLNINGVLNTGGGAVTLLSGHRADGTRRDLILNASNYLMQGVTNNTISITGFGNITVNRNLISSASLSLTAYKNLTVGSGVTVQSGNAQVVNLKAANGVTTDEGIITLNGTINTGNGIVLMSGRDTNGELADLTLNNSNFQYQAIALGSPTLSGFRDINLNRNLTFNAAVNILANRNLSIGSGATISSSPTGFLMLRTANNAPSGIGQFILNGVISMGTGTFTLFSGLDGAGARADLTLDNSNFLMQDTTVGAPTLTGFRDITLNRDILTSGAVSITADRNLTVGNGVTIKGTSVALRGANAVSSGTGVLDMRGIVNVGTGALELVSGHDGSNNRKDFIYNNSIVQLQGANIGAVTLSGFRDISLNSNMDSTGVVTAHTDRNVTLQPGVTLKAAGVNLKAAGGDIVIGSGAHIAGGNGTTLVAGRNFINNSDSTAIMQNSGRWLVYSTNPNSDIAGGLAYDFRSFNCTYGGSCGSLGTGNGFLYRIADLSTANTPPTDIPNKVIREAQNRLDQSRSEMFINSDSFSNPVSDDAPQSLDGRYILTIDQELAEELSLETGEYSF